MKGLTTPELIELNRYVVTDLPSTLTPTVAEMLEAAKEFKAAQRPEVVDLFLMTTAGLRRIEQELRNDRPPATPFQMLSGSLYGIPVEHYPTREQVALRAIELRGMGKRIGIVLD